MPKTHGESHTRLHDIWTGINKRCNPATQNSERYGKRGIGMCDEWRDYTKFRDWALANGYDEFLTIERKDVNGDYSPDNCTWIPLVEQARNRRTTHWVEYDGRRMSLAEACEIAGLPYKQVFFRMARLHWPFEKAISEPMRQPSELLRKCRERNLNYHSIYNRIHVYGWTEEEAFNTPMGGKIE